MKKIILLFIATLLIGGCRTTTRTKSTAESETRAVENASQQTEQARIDSIVKSKVQEALSVAQSSSRESETQQNLRITEITQRETFFNEMVDQKNSGMSVHPPTGRTVETTTRILEQQNIVIQKEMLKHEMTISRMKSDSIALVSQFQKDLTTFQSEKIELEKKLEEFEKKKQVCFPCYLKLWWLWLIIILGIVALIYRSKLKLFLSRFF
jgi:hypothetical protein